jgi:ATP-dependent Clp protease ATP-binding subunit ClpA
MEKLNYPLLCFKMAEESYLGMLIGTDLQVVDSSIRKIKSVLTDHLNRQYQKEGDYPLVDLTAPNLKMIEVSIKPTYRNNAGAFPLAKNVRLSTPLVYGEEEPGVYDCYLPLLNENFYCYELKQLESLAKHFIINSLDMTAPEELYQHFNYPEPSLDVITLKVNENIFFKYDWSKSQEPKLLERLAEKYPYPKAIQKRMSALPDAAWELERYVDLIAEKLIHQRACVLVTGNHGAGKSAALRQAMRKINSLSKKESTQYTFWRIQAQRITASSKYLGEWQESVEEMIWELGMVNGILWVEDLNQLLMEGGKGAEDSVAAYLLPFIQSGRLQLAGEATPQQLESMRRRLPGFVESLQIVEIPDMSPAVIQAVFEKFTAFARQNLKINIHENALQQSIQLLRRFYPYESFPGKGIRFLSEVIGEAQLGGQTEIARQDIIRHFIRRTGLPELFLRDDLLLDQGDLQSFFNQRIIGQEDAVSKLTDIVKVFKAGLNNPHKPITTLIFAGPTGVGKTASAKALADYFFGKGQKQSPLIRIDMSEFQHPSQIVRFLGAGKQPGKLVSDVRERPFAVLLLDEAEKADPSIFDAFLTVLDEGMLVDAFGRVTNFRNCIIILTSNLGASNRRSIGFGSGLPTDETYRSAIGKHFRPEFVNRIDGIVVFQPLMESSIRSIAIKELEEVKQREGFEKKRLSLQFSDKVIQYLTRIGFDEKYGARPLQRALEDEIVKPIANWLLQRPDLKNAVLNVDFDDGLLIKTADNQ